MARDDLDAALDGLYAVPPDAFVAERKRVAKELRSAGERLAAERVAKLPKPTAAAWALNHVAREEPASVRAWLEATAALRDASARAAEVGGDALRAAMAGQRTATTHLIEAVRRRAQPGGRPLSEAMVDRVRALVGSAVADPALAERLAAGRVTEDRAAGDAAQFPPAGGTDDDGASAADTPRPKGARRPPAAAPQRDAEATEAGERVARRDRAAAARAARVEALERDASAAREELERLRDEAARRAEAAEATAGRLEEARRALRRSESEAAAAKDAVKDAERAAAVVERRLRQLEARLRRAGGSA